MSTTFANTIDGNEILAKRSQCDYAGNDIQTTYATKNELPTATSDLTNDSGFITSSDVPVKDVQVGGSSVVNAQGIAEISIPPTGVLDVEVDGSSVVNAQGVAEITLPTFTQVNADWDASSGVSEILNKPDLSIYAESIDLATVATSGSYNDLLDKPTIPAAQVNADWDSSSGVSEILNKPDLSIYAESSDLATVATSGSYNDLLDKPSIPSAQVNADWDATSGVSEILNKPNLATVATTGDYSDLQNKPSIPAAQVNSDWSATSGVAQILNKPSIPTATSDLTNDSGFITLSDVPAQVNADWDASSGVSAILNKPTIPTVDQNYNSSSTNAQSGSAVAQAIAAIPSSSYTAGNGIDITSNVVSAKVDGTTIDTNASGELTVIGGGGGTQVNSDWDATSGVAEILNKPVPKTLSAGTGISISENQSTITISSSVTAPVQDVTVDGTSVVSNGVAAITITTPTVDQTYDGTSANAQSGVAVASALASKQDTLTAGTGIQISNQNVISEDRTILWEGTITVSGNSNLNTVIQLSESVLNFERIEVFCDNKINYLTWHPVSGNTGTPVAYQGLNENTSSDVVLGGAIIQESDYTKIRYRCGYGSSFTTAYRGEYWGYGKPYKVVGIGRIANN